MTPSVLCGLREGSELPSYPWRVPDRRQVRPMDHGMTTGWEGIPAAQGDRNKILSSAASTGHPGHATGALAPVTRRRDIGRLA